MYWAAAGGGIWLLHYLRNRGQARKATADAMGDLADFLPLPALENPLLRRAARRAIDLTQDVCNRRPVVEHPVQAEHIPPDVTPEPLGPIKEAEFTVVEDDEEGPL